MWLASDRNGNFASFVTGGEGPIPIDVLNFERTPVEDIERLVCQMPIVSTVHMLVTLKRPDSFIELAERGIFVYDWTDVHRTQSKAIHVYEPVAAPTSKSRQAGSPPN